eukprot:NODE_6801_length_499_cov_24.844086_g6635_i0.p1 GENE.NODE_6801_length_499_cov_24.844086_g6635_i0~~NODE_6801_length_499_cov_24.844086_g6635_i0.p1  ORF type:complete len:146 (+),score=59.63 NODE_6801_length_499_cov_24.844086_g6635_i0:50-439(+)
MLELKGNTAPYVQYAYARCRSIFRKGQVEEALVPGYIILPTHVAERLLVIKLMQFPRIIATVGDTLLPHTLLNFVYELAALYHPFQEACPVLTAEDEATRHSRLAICLLISKTLKLGLGLCGMDVVEKM